MSYLRSLWTDTAARAANHDLVSVYLPACVYADPTAATPESTTPPKDVSTSAYQQNRIPSQRPIDRRWDESRGLTFATKSQSALKGYTWSSRDGIVSAEKREHRRSYATRPINKQSPPPQARSDPTGKAPKQSTPGTAYGTTLRSLGAASAPPTSGPKSSQQERMEQKIETLEMELQKLRKGETDSRKRITQLEVEIIESKKDARKEKESAYVRGQRAAEDEANSKVRKLEKERDNAVSTRDGMSSRMADLASRTESLEKAIAKAKEDHDASLKNERIRKHRELRTLEDKHRSELVQLKNASQVRKEHRKDYQSYREIFSHVYEQRSFLTSALVALQGTTARTSRVLRDRLHALRRFCESHPGTGKLGKELMKMAEESHDAAEQVVRKTRATRDDLGASDSLLKDKSHYSRLTTDALRFERVTDDIRLEDILYRVVGDLPLRSIFEDTTRRIKELDIASKRAMNATLGEELAKDSQELVKLQGPLKGFISLLNVQRERQRIESWKRAPYVQKAVLMHQEKFRQERRELGTQYMRETEADISSLTAEQYKTRRLLMIGFRKVQSNMVQDAQRHEDLLTKKAHLDVALKRVDEEEAAIDKQIDVALAANEADMIHRLRQLFGDVKGIRSLRTRGPGAAVTGPSSTRLKVPGFASAPFPASPDYEVANARKALQHPGGFRSSHDLKQAERRLVEARKTAIKDNLLRVNRKLSEPSKDTEKRDLWVGEVEKLQSKLRNLDAELVELSNPKISSSIQSTHAIAPPESDASESSSHPQPVTDVASTSQTVLQTTRPSMTYRPTGSIGHRPLRPSVVRLIGRQARRGPSAKRAFSTGALRALPQHVDHATVDTDTTKPGANELDQAYSEHEQHDQFGSHQKPGSRGPLQATTTDSTSPVMDNSTEDSPSSSESSASSFENDESVAEDFTILAEEEDTPLSFQIPAADYRTAIMASKSTSAAYWRYSLYKNAEGNSPATHYCTTFEQTEAQITKFANEKVVGFDLEWELGAYPGKSSIKRCVSLIQIAAEDRVGLFQIGMFKGADNTEELMPTALRELLENPNIIKAGVNISNDAARIRTCFGIEMRGIFELSRLYKIVTLSESEPHKVNRSLVKLADQVQNVLMLPLAKDDVRTSAWSKKLSPQQIEYAVSDAYAGLRIFHALEAKRKLMDPRPPRPAFWELDLPLVLGDGTVIDRRPRAAKQPAAAAEKPADEGDDSDQEFFDAVENIDPYELAAEKDEVSYPELPPLEGLSISSDNTDEPRVEPSSRSSATATLEPPATDRIVPAEPVPTQDQSAEAAEASTWATDYLSQRPSSANAALSKVPAVRERPLLAYHIWHHQGFDIKASAALLRDPPLAMTTVASYIAEVIKKEQLPYDTERAKEVLSILPRSVHGRYATIVEKVGDVETAR